MAHTLKLFPNLTKAEKLDDHEELRTRAGLGKTIFYRMKPFISWNIKMLNTNLHYLLQMDYEQVSLSHQIFISIIIKSPVRSERNRHVMCDKFLISHLLSLRSDTL